MHCNFNADEDGIYFSIHPSLRTSFINPKSHYLIIIINYSATPMNMWLCK